MTAFYFTTKVTFCVCVYTLETLIRTINATGRQASKQSGHHRKHTEAAIRFESSGARFRLCFDFGFGKCLWVLKRRFILSFAFFLSLILAEKKNAASSNTVSLNKTA